MTNFDSRGNHHHSLRANVGSDRLRLPAPLTQPLPIESLRALLGKNGDAYLANPQHREQLVAQLGTPFKMVDIALAVGLDPGLVSQVKAIVLAWYEEQLRDGMVDAWLFTDRVEERAQESVRWHKFAREALAQFFQLKFGAEIEWKATEDRGDVHWLVRVPIRVFEESS